MVFSSSCLCLSPSYMTEGNKTFSFVYHFQWSFKMIKIKPCFYSFPFKFSQVRAFLNTFGFVSWRNVQKFRKTKFRCVRTYIFRSWRLLVNIFLVRGKEIEFPSIKYDFSAVKRKNIKRITVNNYTLLQIIVFYGVILEG